MIAPGRVDRPDHSSAPAILRAALVNLLGAEIAKVTRYPSPPRFAEGGDFR